MNKITGNIILLAVAAVFAAAPVSAQNEIREGTSPEDVIEMLGKPKASFAGKGTTIFMYDRGEIYFEDGRLVRHNLVSESEARIMLQREASERQARQIARAKAAANLREKGAAVKAQKKADPRFIILPLDKRLAYWKSFRRIYPGVSVESEIKAIEDRIQAGGQEDMNAKRVAVVNRIKQLEKEITQAEQVRGAGVDAARATIISHTKELKELRAIQRKIGLPEDNPSGGAAPAGPTIPFQRSENPEPRENKFIPAEQTDPNALS